MAPKAGAKAVPVAKKPVQTVAKKGAVKTSAIKTVAKKMEEIKLEEVKVEEVLEPPKDEPQVEVNEHDLPLENQDFIEMGFRELKKLVEN